jgi:hypothetical protein
MSHGAVTCHGDFCIELSGNRRLLLEAVKHVHRFFEFRHVEHPPGAEALADTDFPRTRADALERFSVSGLEARLHLAKVEARLPAYCLGKSEQVVQRRTYPADLSFVNHGYLACIKFYTNIRRQTSFVLRRDGNHLTNLTIPRPFVRTAK